MNALSRCAGLALAATGCLPGLALASPATTTSPVAGTLTAPDSSDFFLTGDWGGARSHLSQQGVTLYFNLNIAPAHNFSGGYRHTTTVAKQGTLGVWLDLAKLAHWQGGQFQITYTSRWGRSLDSAAQIGENERAQDNWGRGETWWLTQFWLQQSLFNNRLSVRLGRLPVDADFGFEECTFLNLSFCSSIIGNMVYKLWLDWPVSQYGVRIKLASSRYTYVQLGAYQVNPTYIDNNWARKRAWTLQSPRGTQGALLPLEFGWTPALHGLDGSYKFGLYYSNAGGSDLYLNQQRAPIAIAGGKPLHRDSAYGAYLAFEQQLSGNNDGQGTVLFFNAGKSDRYTAQLDTQFTLGLRYTGLGNRRNDGIGVALAATHNSSYYADYAKLYNRIHPHSPMVYGSGYEHVLEVYYQWVPIPSIVIRPDLQYIADPGGVEHRHHALIGGFRTLINF